MIAHEVNKAMDNSLSSMMAHEVDRSVDNSLSSMIAHEVNRSTDDSMSSMITHEINEAMDNLLSSMIAHEVSGSADNSLSSRIVHEADRSIDNSLTSMIAHEVNKAMDNSLSSMMAHEVDGSVDNSLSSMIAHEVSRSTDDSLSSMITHEINEAMDNSLSSMIAHEVNGSADNSLSSRIVHEADRSIDNSLISMIAHEVNKAMDNSLSSMMAHEVDRSVDNSLSSMIAHEINRSTDDSLGSMILHDVDRSMDNSLASMIAHEACKTKGSMDMSLSSMSMSQEVNKSLEKLYPSMLSHILLQTDQEHLNITAVGERMRERSQSMESDTILADFEDDIEEDDDFCSSDEEWKYETNCDDEKIDYSKHIKTIRNHNRASSRDAMNKEREIMNDIIKKDKDYVTESDLDLLLIQEEAANEIDETVEDSVFLTEIPKNENCDEGVETIEVIDIMREEEGNFVRSSLTMKCSSNQNLVSTSMEGGNDITNETQAKLECESVSQNIVFPWNIKVSNNWQENGKNEEIKIKSDGDIMLDLTNIKPGSYKYKFLINGTSFCDQSLPHEEEPFDCRNVFIIWSNNFPPSKAESVTINAQVTLPWKVQLTGNWPVQPKTIDCKVCTNGDIVARLPALTTGVYQYNFLINNCHFVDESLPFKQDYLTSHNLLVVRDNGDVAWQTSQ